MLDKVSEKKNKKKKLLAEKQESDEATARKMQLTQGGR